MPAGKCPLPMEAFLSCYIHANKDHRQRQKHLPRSPSLLSHICPGSARAGFPLRLPYAVSLQREALTSTVGDTVPEFVQDLGRKICWISSLPACLLFQEFPKIVRDINRRHQNHLRDDSALGAPLHLENGPVISFGGARNRITACLGRNFSVPLNAFPPKGLWKPAPYHPA